LTHYAVTVTFQSLSLSWQLCCITCCCLLNYTFVNVASWWILIEVVEFGAPHPFKEGLQGGDLSQGNVARDLI